MSALPPPLATAAGSAGRAPRRSRSALALSVALGTLGAVTAPGCGLFSDGAGGEDGCLSTQEYFDETVWPQVLGTVCIECHSPDGPAVDQLSKFQLLPPGYPGFLEENLERITVFAKTEFEGQSVLLQKPLGLLDHGGGQKIREGSAEYEALETLVGMLRDGNSCGDEDSVPTFEDVELLGPTATLRKASLHLLGRLPTPEETERVSAQGEAALGGVIDGLLTEEAFYDRLKDLWNDELLTNRYLAYSGYAANVLSDEAYPATGADFEAVTDEDERRAINRALAQEPLEFIAFLVREGRPFTDLVEGQYTVVNPKSAPYLNAEVSFDDPANVEEWREAPRRAFIDGVLTDIPAAGILTSPMWLNRFPTTETNRNRHRARMVLDTFLATDILAIGERPLDPTQSSRYANPTRDDPSCNSCHEVLDPIAGAFQKFSDYDAERYEPDRDWHRDMKAPGYGSEQMTLDDFDSAPTWLGQRIARDPRFPYAMVKIVYEGLIGRPPRAYPSELDSPTYAAEFVAWRDQERSLQAVAEAFAKDGYDLRTVFRELILGPYYRASAVSGELDEARSVELGELGTARLSTPELLSRKIEATTGLPWARSWDGADLLTSEYRILYGGIDSDSITRRLTTPSGVMASVMWRMANEVSCGVAAYDFAKPKSERLLFREVELDDEPETEAGDAVAAAQERIRSNIRYLHAHLLGEDATDEEVERTFGLFVEAWREGQARLADESDAIHPWLPWRCQYRRLPGAEEDLPEEQRLDDDPDYTVRAWMAVLTYLLSDYRFVYE